MNLDDGPVRPSHATPIFAAASARNFRIASAHLVVTTFSDNPGWVTRLRKGSKLRVNVGKRVPNFDLGGIDEAFAALYACQKKHNRA